jgi:periplasmic protein TonB
VFEQSLLLNHPGKRSWNFVASLGAELLAVGLVLLIPLLYSDHLPMFHWKDIAIGPPPAPTPPVPQHVHLGDGSAPSRAPRPVFIWNPKASPEPVQTSTTDLIPDAPPMVNAANGIGIGGRNPLIGTFIPNVVAAPPPLPKPEVETTKSAPLRVGGDVLMAKLIHKVIPEYPAIARSARISGVVHLVGVIGKDGTVQNLQLVSGHPILARAAMEAVRQWVYKPTLLNGIPVEVVAPIEVDFNLQ